MTEVGWPCFHLRDDAIHVLGWSPDQSTSLWNGREIVPQQYVAYAFFPYFSLIQFATPIRIPSVKNAPGASPIKAQRY
jgi:hypothetical protein